MTSMIAKIYKKSFTGIPTTKEYQVKFKQLYLVIGTEVATGGVLKNFAKFIGKHLCQSLFFNACNFIKKETLPLVFSCEFCEFFKNTFFTEHLRATASNGNMQ